MSQKPLKLWQHDHSFGQQYRREGERRASIVITITATMMVVEIVAGLVFGSMALLADGLHMASHATALMISVYAYIYARRHAHDPRYSFGTGKVNALGGFTGAVLLAVFALMMAWGSLERIIHPVAIAFDQAIVVAMIGLVINGASVFILDHRDDHGHGHSPHDHEDHHDHHPDHNLKSAYYHVLADALTSILAIVALVAAKYFGLVWMDPVMGIVGAVLVCRWSWGLLRDTSGILLDSQGPRKIQDAIKAGIETTKDAHIADLHVWAVGPNIYSAIIAVVARDPQTPQYYKDLLPDDLGLVHVTVEVHTNTASAPSDG